MSLIQELCDKISSDDGGDDIGSDKTIILHIVEVEGKLYSYTHAVNEEFVQFVEANLSTGLHLSYLSTENNVLYYVGRIVDEVNVECSPIFKKLSEIYQKYHDK